MVYGVVVDPEGMRWADAFDRCLALSVEGWSRWRLPTKPEVSDLRRQIPRGSYWTGAASGRDPDAAWVYDTKDRRAALFLEQEPTGSVVCVHDAPRD